MLMPLLNQIESDYQQALKARNHNVVNTLRMVLAALKNEVINKKAELSDEEIVKVLKSEIKKRNEAFTEYEKADRMELANKEKEELLILEKYLPEQLGEEEIKKIVDEAVAELGEDANFGQIMGKVMPKLQGQADGNLVKQIVEQAMK